jgi:hypothetical protein
MAVRVGRDCGEDLFQQITGDRYPTSVDLAGPGDLLKRSFAIPIRGVGEALT